MEHQGKGALAEWRRHGMVPVAGALGYASSVIHIYGFGPYIVPIAHEFGWSRTVVTFGLTLATLLQAVFSIPVGMAVDRFSPRRMALTGLPLAALAFAAIGTASGGTVGWYLLWTLMALAVLPIQASVWTTAVANCFTASRGMAFAVTLCGASVATSLFPWLATTLIASKGWHAAFAWQAGLVFAVSAPVIFLFFRTTRDEPRSQDSPGAVEHSGMSFGEGLVSTVYLRLLLASLLFTFTVVGLVVQFVPILTDSGMDKQTAAGIAAIVGLFSLAGRLGTGLLLDRFRASRVGAVVFLLPAGACLALILSGASAHGAMLAAVLLGFTLGSEIDVVAYLVTRHFGLRSFGALYGGLLVALSTGSALGPLGVARAFDVTGRYASFLWLAVGLMLAASLLLASLPKPPETEAAT